MDPKILYANYFLLQEKHAVTKEACRLQSCILIMKRQRRPMDYPQSMFIIYINKMEASGLLHSIIKNEGGLRIQVQMRPVIGGLRPPHF